MAAERTLVVTGSRVARWARLASLAGLLLFFFAMSVQKIWVADFWWQLRTGQWIVEHGALPVHDVFSYTAGAREWIELRWLYCVALFLGWRIGGAGLLILLQTLVIGSAFLAIAWPLRRTVATLQGTLLLALGVWAASYRFVVRPEIVSYLLVAVFLLVLDGTRQGRFPRLRWILPVLQVVWTNAHTLFVFGPVLAWTFAAGEGLRHLLARARGRSVDPGASGTSLGSRGSASPAPAAGHGVPGGPRNAGGDAKARLPILDVPLLALAGAVTAACWINPYFHRGAMFPLLLFGEIHAESILGRTILEFRSPFASGRLTLDFAAAALLALASAATFVANRRRLDPVRFALWALLLYLGSVAMRNIALFAYVATWVSLRNLADVLEDVDARLDTGRGAAATGGDHRVGARGPAALAAFRGALENSAAGPLATAGHLAVAAALTFGAWYSVSGRYHAMRGCDPEFGLGVAECTTPAAATDFILEAGASPQLFHAMADGSYLIWAAKDRFPVYVDGRLEVYGEDFVEDYLGVATRDWQAFADRWRIETVMVHREHFAPLLTKLRQLPQWVLVHVDPRDMVYVRDVPEHADLIRKYRIDLDESWTPRGPEPEEAPLGWRRWIGSVNRPWYTYGMAQTFLQLDSYANAAVYLERARPLMRDDPALSLALAQLYARTRDYERAIPYYRDALARLPAEPLHWCELGQALYLAGDPDAAVEAYGQALRIRPDLYEAHYNLGVVAYKRGRPKDAAAHFENALRARPNDETARRALQVVAPRP